MDALGTLPDLSLDVEECDLYRPKGFTTVALALNNDIGRLCAIRKQDQTEKATRLFAIEFYDTINAPHVVLRWKYLSQKEAFETVIWLGNLAVVGCSDGSLLTFSPFQRTPKRHKICASQIVASTTVSSSQIAIASESSEIILLEFDKKDGFALTKTVKFPSEQRIVALAASLKFSCLAVGLVDAIALIPLPSGEQSLIKISQNGNKSTIVWSLLFVDEFLFSGDSRGKIMIYNPKTTALIRIIHSHQADILTMVYDGCFLYASGTDYRIQVLSRTQSANKKTEWNTVGQRIIHENDVRCMVKTNDWLISGGAEHKILVSTQPNFVYTTLTETCCSVANDGRYLLIPQLEQVNLWRRPEHNAEVFTFESLSVFTVESGPKLLANMTFSAYTIVLGGVISSDGRHIIVLTSLGLYVYELLPAISEKVQIKLLYSVAENENEPITAFCSTNSALYFTRGSTVLERFDYKTLEKVVVASRKSKDMVTKLVIDSAESWCLALTARSELLSIDLQAENVDVDERFEKLEIAFVPADFKLHYTKENDPLAILVVSGVVNKLIFLNLKTKLETKTPILLKNHIGKRSVITSASNVVNNAMVLQTTRNKCCIVSRLNEVQSFVFSVQEDKRRPLKPRTRKVSEGPGKKIGKKARRRRNDKRSGDEASDDKDVSANEEAYFDDNELDQFLGNELTVPDQDAEQALGEVEYEDYLPPFPSESHWVVTDANKVTILKIGSQPEHPPIWEPINIRRFGRQ